MKYIKKSQSEIEKDRLECERIKIILDQRYSNEAMSKQVPSEDVYIDDLKRFINFANKKSGPLTIFSNYCIFQGQDGLWKEPHKIYMKIIKLRRPVFYLLQRSWFNIRFNLLGRVFQKILRVTTFLGLAGKE